jgi:hypothetical protein
MEFGIDANNPLNVIRATNQSERKMLESDVLQTKLSYQRVEALKDVHGEIYEGKEFSAKSNGTSLRVAIPDFMGDDRRAAYYLRMALDANAVENGCLPLHAAALTNDGLTQFIFAETGKGKSFTLNTLLAHDSGIIPIGDDHIVIGNDKVSGNGVMRTRIRSGEDKDYSSLYGDRVLPLEDYEIVLVDVTGKNEAYEMGSVDLTENEVARRSTLKYLDKQPREAEVRALRDSIVSKDVSNEYRRRFNEFVGGAKRILKLSGGQDQLLKELLVQS